MTKTQIMESALNAANKKYPGESNFKINEAYYYGHIAGQELALQSGLRWVKASERLPVDKTNKKKYFCKFYFLGQLQSEDVVTGAYIHSVKNLLRPLSGEEVQYYSFNEIEWLDESAPPQSADGLRDALEKLVSMQNIQLAVIGYVGFKNEDAMVKDTNEWKELNAAMEAARSALSGTEPAYTKDQIQSLFCRYWEMDAGYFIRENFDGWFEKQFPLPEFKGWEEDGTPVK